MTFSYRCERGHAREAEFDPGHAAPSIRCTCGATALRDFAADWGTQTVNTGDPFRSYHLSHAKASAAVAQQRVIGGPTDNFERRREEAVRGIQFIGNETGGMTKLAQRAIARGKESK